MRLASIYTSLYTSFFFFFVFSKVFKLFLDRYIICFCETLRNCKWRLMLCLVNYYHSANIIIAKVWKRELITPFKLNLNLHSISFIQLFKEFLPLARLFEMIIYLFFNFLKFINLPNIFYLWKRFDISSLRNKFTSGNCPKKSPWCIDIMLYICKQPTFLSDARYNIDSKAVKSLERGESIADSRTNKITSSPAAVYTT